jgi:small conductance mechanosensitive channel
MELPEIDFPRIGDLLSAVADKLIGWVEGFVVMLPNLLVATLVLVFFWVLARWGARAVERVLLRLTGNRSMSGLMGTVARLAMILTGVFIALGLLDLDKTVTSLLAGVGVVGLALGFAFQDIAANFMSGLLMALNRPFRAGDLVEIAGHLGRIETVELRATSIETLDGLSLLIPNKDVFQNTIVNYTRTACRRLEIAVGTAYSDDMEEVERVVTEAVSDLPGRDASRDVQVLFDAFGSSSIDFRVLVWLSSSDQMAYRQARSDGMKRIKRALDEAGLTIPFPIRTVDFGADGVGGVGLGAVERIRIAAESAEAPAAGDGGT